VALKYGRDDSLTKVIKLACLVPFALMHIAGLTADHGFVGFDFVARPTQFAAVLALLSKPDTVEHEPGSLLSHTQSFGNLTTGDAVLAVVDKPHGRKPLIETDGAVFEDGIDLNGELASRVPHAALPAQLVLEEANRSATATRTNYAVFPLRATGYEIVKAVLGIGEIHHRFLKALGFVGAFHNSILPRKHVLRKYIFAEFFGEFLLPLFAKRGGKDEEDFAAAFGPSLRDDDTGFDGLAEPYFVGEEDAFGEWGANSKKGGIDLVGVEVNAGVGDRAREGFDGSRGSAKC
jgi:hypothetical protein